MTERAECSRDRLFVRLVDVMESDVAKMQARSPENLKFTLNRLHDARVIVAKVRRSSGFSDGANVTIQKTDSGIDIGCSAPNQERFTATPLFDEAGTCRLDVNGQPLELWQASRKALEKLFFS